MTSHVADHLDYYLDLGLCVIPAFPRSKKPAVQWLEYQRRRPTAGEIESWRSRYWSRGYNIGVVCGQVSGGLTCIDIDDDRFLRLFDIEKLKRDTMVVETGSGKLHIYVLSDRRVRTTRFMEGGRSVIEVRGEGSFVVLPNSIHPETGRPYRLLSKPPSLLTVSDPVSSVKRITGLDEEERIETGRIGGGVGFEPPCISALMNTTIPEGFRNESICRLTSYMYQRGVSFDVALDYAIIWNEEHCNPPLDEREVESVVKSIYRHGYRYGCKSMKIFKCSKRCPVYRARNPGRDRLAEMVRGALKVEAE